MTAPTAQPCAPWLANLPAEVAAAARAAADDAPVMSAEQRDRIAAIMRGGNG